MLFSQEGNLGTAVAAVPVELSSRINASEWIKSVTEILGGGGSGTALIAQGGGTKVDQLEEARKKALEFLEAKSKE